jgi:hypothetical protein
MPKTKHLKHVSPVSMGHLGIFILIFAVIGGVALWRSFAAPNPSLPGDLNNDNTVNVTDMSILLSNYGTANTTADINTDGTVNVLDMSILLSNYGKTYTPPSSGFTTSLTNGMTITPPYTWTFNPGVITTKGYFWADGNLLSSGPPAANGSYSFSIQSSTLAAGAHTLGHAWDLPDGTHLAPPNSYSVTIAGTATPPPSGGGSLIYSGNFETGDISPWNWGGQCINTGENPDTLFNRGTVTVSGAYAGEGAYGARFVLPTDGSRRQACEVLDHRPLVVDTYYSLMFKLDPGNTTNAWGATIDQLNYQGIWGPPEGLFARSSTTDAEATPNSVGMIIQSGFCNAVSTSNPGCTNYSSYYGSTTGGLQYAIPPGQLKFGQWHEVVCHIHFAIDSSGVYECWNRLKGQTTWTLSGRYSGIPTVQWDTTPSLPSEDVDKIGAYRPQDTTSQWTADEDGFYKGTTFDSVATRLP